MRQFEYTITDPLGLHARPAGLLAQTARACADAEITIARGADSAKATQLMRLMSLGLQPGDRVKVTAEGPGEDAAIAAMEAFFRDRL